MKERLFPIPVSPRIVSAVCPKAGDAKKIDQNMQKYRESDPKKSNDFASIRARFKAPGKKYRSLDHNSLFLRTSSYACCGGVRNKKDGGDIET